MIAATYERVSRMTQASGFSLTSQRQSMHEYAQAQGWTLPEQLRFRDGEDADASGADWDLPGLTAMLEAARRSAFSVLIVPDLDRFARTLVKGLVLEEQLNKYGVRVVYQRVPVEDSPEGRLLKTQLFAFAEYEREKFRLRSMTNTRTKALSGRVVGKGKAPYGYTFTHETTSGGKQRVAGLAIDAATEPIVRRILHELRSRSAAHVQRGLNADAIPSPAGKQWTVRTVLGISQDPVYCGAWVYGKHGQRVPADGSVGIVVPVPAYIGRDEWEQLQLLTSGRRRGPGARTLPESDLYLLRGMLVCGHCQTQLHAVLNNGHRYYRCPGAYESTARVLNRGVCTLPPVNARAIEAELWQRLNATLLSPERLAAGIQAARAQHAEADAMRHDRMTAVEREVTAQRRRLDTWVSRLVDLGEGELYEAAMRQAREIEALIARLESEYRELQAYRSDGLSEAEASGILAFADEIREGLANATDADRQRVYALLHVRGRVMSDPAGVKLALKHRFRIEWKTAIGVLENITCSLDPVMLFSSGIGTDDFAILSGRIAAD